MSICYKHPQGTYTGLTYHLPVLVVFIEVCNIHGLVLDFCNLCVQLASDK